MIWLLSWIHLIIHRLKKAKVDFIIDPITNYPLSKFILVSTTYSCHSLPDSEEVVVPGMSCLGLLSSRPQEPTWTHDPRYGPTHTDPQQPTTTTPQPTTTTHTAHHTINQNKKVKTQNHGRKQTPLGRPPIRRRR